MRVCLLATLLILNGCAGVVTDQNGYTATATPGAQSVATNSFPSSATDAEPDDSSETLKEIAWQSFGAILTPLYFVYVGLTDSLLL
jgi:hypothetical protein